MLIKILKTFVSSPNTRSCYICLFSVIWISCANNNQKNHIQNIDTSNITISKIDSSCIKDICSIGKKTIQGIIDDQIVMSSFDNTKRHLYLYDKNGNATQKLLLYDSELQYNFEFARHFYIHKDSIGVAIGNKFVYMTLAYTDIKRGLFKPNYSIKYTGDMKIPYKYKNKYIVAGTGKKGSHFIYEPFNHKKTFYNFYPFTKDRKKFNFMDYRGVASMNESEGIYIYGSTKKNLLSFIKINNDFTMSLIRQINNIDYVALCGENKSENNVFYRNISISDDFLFVSYGQNISKESKSYIMKYDWSGNLKTIFCLNTNISSFAVDDSSQAIYITNNNTLKYFKINAD